MYFMYVKLIYPLKGEYRGKSGINGPFKPFYLGNVSTGISYACLQVGRF